MELGTVVILVAVGFLYWQTRDRWDWPGMAKKAITIALVLASAVGAIGYSAYWIYSRPKIQDEYWGLRVGQSLADVRFLKGLPDSLGADATHYYIGSDATYRVRFDDRSRIATVLGTGKYALSIQEIRVGDSFTEVIERFGDDPTILNAEGHFLVQLDGVEIGVVNSGKTPLRLEAAWRGKKSDPTRVLYYEDLGLCFVMKKGAVVGIAIKDATPKRPDWSWDSFWEAIMASILVVWFSLLAFVARKSQVDSDKREKTWTILRDKLKSGGNAFEEEVLLGSGKRAIAFPNWSTLFGGSLCMAFLFVIIWFTKVAGLVWDTLRYLYLLVSA